MTPDGPLAHGFDQWVLYGIPADVTSPDEGDDQGYVAGSNGLGRLGYFPPSPPPGHGAHFYYFHLYALDAAPDLPPGLGRAVLLEIIDDHIIQQARVPGSFSQ
jgi:phosphatidylethanolamine-binding protein (PEBP) family uncharacterized protein